MSDTVLKSYFDALEGKQLAEEDLLSIIESDPKFVYEELQRSDLPEVMRNLYQPYLDVIKQAITKKKKQYSDAIIYNYSGEILMLLRVEKDSDVEFANKWGLPGGHIDEGETPEQACKREVMEETNYVLDSCSLRHVKETDTCVIHYFTCYVNQDQIPILDISEHKNLMWVNKDKLQELECIFDLKDTLNNLIFQYSDVVEKGRKAYPIGAKSKNGLFEKTATGWKPLKKIPKVDNKDQEKKIIKDEINFGDVVNDKSFIKFLDSLDVPKQIQPTETKDLGAGFCGMVAQWMATQHPEAVICAQFVSMGLYHAWVKIGDKFYDGLDPKGVSDWKNLKIFKNSSYPPSYDEYSLKEFEKAYKEEYEDDVEEEKIHAQHDKERRSNVDVEYVHGDKDKFLKWFGNSKVVDEDNYPKIMYHATTADFDKFERKNKDELGFHFGTYGQAKSRLEAIEHRGGASLMPVYLRVENPARFNDMNDWGNPTILAQEMFDQGILKNRDLIEQFETVSDIVEYLKIQGYDAIVYKNEFENADRAFDDDDLEDSYIVFDSNQIKSTIGNKEYSNEDSITKAEQEIDKALEVFKQAFDEDKITPEEYVEALHKSKQKKKILSTRKSTGKKFFQTHEVGHEQSSHLLNYMEGLSKMNVHPKQKAFFDWQLHNAKQIHTISTDEIRNKYPHIDEFLKTNDVAIKQCFMNASRLSMFCKDVQYVEGLISLHGIPIEHAWNKIGDDYFDVTKDIALAEYNKPGQEFTKEYVSLIELNRDETTSAAIDTDTYGSYLVWKYEKDHDIKKAEETHKVGATKNWHGQNFRMTTSGWVHDDEKNSSLKYEKNSTKQKIQDYSDDELEDHAQRSSLEDLQRTIKEGRNPKLRDVAIKHLATRKAKENEHSLYDLMILEDVDEHDYMKNKNTIHFDSDIDEELINKLNFHGIRYLVNSKEVEKSTK